jgi:hypothetical protein
MHGRNEKFIWELVRKSERIFQFGRRNWENSTKMDLKNIKRRFPDSSGFG